MVVLYIILGILALALLLPAGVRVLYNEDGLLLKLIYGPFRLRLLPSKKKKKKKEKPEKKEQRKKTETKPAQKKKGGSLAGIMEYVPTALDFLQGLRRRLLVRKLVLYINLAGDDPCDLALLYGKLTGGAGGLIALLEQWFRIRRRDIQVFCDFLGDETKVYADATIVACPGRLIWLTLRYGFKLLKIFLKQNSDKAV